MPIPVEDLIELAKDNNTTLYYFGDDQKTQYIVNGGKVYVSGSFSPLTDNPPEVAKIFLGTLKELAKNTKKTYLFKEDAPNWAPSNEKSEFTKKNAHTVDQYSDQIPGVGDDSLGFVTEKPPRGNEDFKTSSDNNYYDKRGNKNQKTSQEIQKTIQKTIQKAIQNTPLQKIKTILFTKK